MLARSRQLPCSIEPPNTFVCREMLRGIWHRMLTLRLLWLCVECRKCRIAPNSVEFWWNRTRSCLPSSPHYQTLWTKYASILDVISNYVFWYKVLLPIIEFFLFFFVKFSIMRLMWKELVVVSIGFVQQCCISYVTLLLLYSYSILLYCNIRCRLSLTYFSFVPSVSHLLS